MPICLVGGCPVAVPKGTRRCPEHAAEYRRAHPRGEHAGRTGTTALWRKLKKQAKRRDGNRCTATLDDGTRCPHATASYHHVVPKYQGGEDELSNIASRCKQHHDADHAERPGWGSTTPPGTCPPISERTGRASAQVRRFPDVCPPLDQVSAPDSASGASPGHIERPNSGRLEGK